MFSVDVLSVLIWKQAWLKTLNVKGANQFRYVLLAEVVPRLLIAKNAKEYTQKTQKRTLTFGMIG